MTKITEGYGKSSIASLFQSGDIINFFFSKKSFTNTIRVSNNLNPDQVWFFHDHSPWKNFADPARVEPATSWSPIGRTFNWATEARLEAPVYYNSYQLVQMSLSSSLLGRKCKPGLMSICHMINQKWSYTLWLRYKKKVIKPWIIGQLQRDPAVSGYLLQRKCMPGFLGCADFSLKVWWRKCMPSLMEEVYARFWWREGMPGFMEEAYARFYRESVCQVWWRKCMPMPSLIEEVYARFDGGSICQVLMDEVYVIFWWRNCMPCLMEELYASFDGQSICQVLMEKVYARFDGGNVCQVLMQKGFARRRCMPGLVEEVYARFWWRECMPGLMEEVYARFNGASVYSMAVGVTLNRKWS